MEDTLANLSRLAVLESGLEANQACLVSSLHENEFHVSVDLRRFLMPHLDRMNDQHADIFRPNYTDVHKVEVVCESQKSTESTRRLQYIT